MQELLGTSIMDKYTNWNNMTFWSRQNFHQSNLNIQQNYFTAVWEKHLSLKKMSEGGKSGAFWLISE